MTCIVGIRSPGGVVIGGDSAGTSGDDVELRADAKVFAIGPYIVGFTTSFRMGQLLQHALKPPAPPSDGARLHGFMVTKFVDQVRRCLKAGGFAGRGDATEEGGTFLVGVRGRLFCVEGDYQVAEPGLEYTAVGSGARYALGSLASTEGEASARDRVERALAAAAKFSGSVRPPFVVLEARG